MSTLKQEIGNTFKSLALGERRWWRRAGGRASSTGRGSSPSRLTHRAGRGRGEGGGAGVPAYLRTGVRRRLDLLGQLSNSRSSNLGEGCGEDKRGRGGITASGGGRGERGTQVGLPGDWGLDGMTAEAGNESTCSMPAIITDRLHHH